MVQKIGRNKKDLKVGKISTKYGILTVQEKKVAHDINKIKIILEMNPWKIEVEARRLKESNMSIDKQMEKEK